MISEAITATAAVVVPVATLFWYLSGLKVESAIRKDNDRLLKEINGTYLRSAGSKLTGGEVERRIADAERKIDMLHEYSHDRTHDLANQIAALTLQAHPRKP